MNTILSREAIEAAGLVFLAGGFYFAVRRGLADLRRDVNGVGRKSRKIELALIDFVDDPAKKTRLIDLLKD